MLLIDWHQANPKENEELKHTLCFYELQKLGGNFVRETIKEHAASLFVSFPASLDSLFTKLPPFLFVQTQPKNSSSLMPTLQRILGSLRAFQPYNNTPVIGTVFSSPRAQLSAFLNAPDSSELIRDLARVVSHRGVVFFKDQNIQLDQQKELTRRMGELTGRPASSDLHQHPVSETTPELGDVIVIDSQQYVRCSLYWNEIVSFLKLFY